MKLFKFNLRDQVKDELTGFAGIITARTEYLNGCLQYCVKPQKLKKDGTMPEAEWFDEQQLDLTKKIKATKKKPATGGPQSDQPNERCVL